MPANDENQSVAGATPCNFVGKSAEIAMQAAPIGGSTNQSPIRPLDYSSPQMEGNAGSSSVNAWRFTIAACLLLVGAMTFSSLRPTIGGRSLMARIRAARADIDSLELALDAHLTDTGQYPSASTGLQALVQAPNAVGNWHGPYVQKIPSDPWGTPYQYHFPGAHNTSTFDLFSAGADKLFGTGDDLVNWAQNGK